MQHLLIVEEGMVPQFSLSKSILTVSLITLFSCSGSDSGSSSGKSGGKRTRDTTAPKLTLTSPGNRQDISGLYSLTLEGECEFGATDVMIYGDINGAETSTPCEEDGTFSTDVDVKNREEGRSIILEQADSKGNSAKVSVHLGKFVFVLDNIKQVALGANHSCTLTNDGEVKCWGRNNKGQLGNHSTTDSSYPVDVHTDSSNTDILSDIEQISLGSEHTCALTTTGKVKCWGEGEYGRLGNGETSDSNTQVDVCAAAPAGNSNCDLLEDISAISLGTGFHTCALTTRWKCQVLGAWKLWTTGQ